MGAEYGEAQKGGLINVAHTHTRLFSNHLFSSAYLIGDN